MFTIYYIIYHLFFEGDNRRWRNTLFMARGKCWLIDQCHVSSLITVFNHHSPAHWLTPVRYGSNEHRRIMCPSPHSGIWAGFELRWMGRGTKPEGCCTRYIGEQIAQATLYLPLTCPSSVQRWPPSNSTLTTTTTQLPASSNATPNATTCHISNFFAVSPHSSSATSTYSSFPMSTRGFSSTSTHGFSPTSTRSSSATSTANSSTMLTSSSSTMLTDSRLLCHINWQLIHHVDWQLIRHVDWQLLHHIHLQILSHVDCNIRCSGTY